MVTFCHNAICWPELQTERFHVCIHVIKCFSLHHNGETKYFLYLSLTRNRREAHISRLAKELRKVWRCSCWIKGNCILIYEFKYGQTWKIRLSPLNLPIYNTFKKHYDTAPVNLFGGSDRKSTVIYCLRFYISFYRSWLMV